MEALVGSHRKRCAIHSDSIVLARTLGNPEQPQLSERRIRTSGNSCGCLRVKAAGWTSPSPLSVQEWLQTSPRSIPIVISTLDCLSGNSAMSGCAGFFMGNSLSDPKGLLIPFLGTKVRRIKMIAVLLPTSVGSLQNGGKFLGRTMKSQIKLGTVFGVELGLHYSWLVIAFLIAFSLAEQFHAVNRDWSAVLVWTIAVVTGVLFFACLIAHEMFHAVVANAHGNPVHKITLFLLGGVAQIEKEASDPKTEFWMAIVGPITSGVLGLILLGLARLDGWSPWMQPTTPGAALLVWLGYINLALGAFNMIPGFPLDGGRVLRALLWWAMKDVKRNAGSGWCRAGHRRFIHRLWNHSVLSGRRSWRIVDCIYRLVPLACCRRHVHAGQGGFTSSRLARERCDV
jgi:Zn-dependent protease